MRSQATRIIVRNHNWGHAAVVLISQRSDCNRCGNSSAAREQGHPQAVAKSIRSPADRLSNEHATRQRARNPPKDAHPDPSFCVRRSPSARAQYESVLGCGRARDARATVS